MLLLKNSVEQKLSDIVYPLKSSDFDHFFGSALNNKAFEQFPKLDSWTVFMHAEDLTQTDKMISCLSQFHDYYGYDLQRPEYVKISSWNVDDWLVEIAQNLGDTKKMFLVILPEKMDTPTFYRKIKETITLGKGVNCQVITAKTLRKYD